MIRLYVLPAPLVIILDYWSRLCHWSIYLSKISLILDERMNTSSNRFHSATVGAFAVRPQAAFQTVSNVIARTLDLDHVRNCY